MTIDPNFLARLKRSLLLSEVIGERVKLTKKGKRLQGLCPFHADKNPSLSVDDALGKYHCWGCGAKGDVYDWMREVDKGGDFVANVEYLAMKAGMAIQKQTHQEITDEKKTLYKALYKAHALYRHGLNRNSAAMRFLINRGLSAETINCWEIGAVSKGIVALLQREFATHDLMNTGLIGLNENDHPYDRLRERVIIPLKNSHGQLIGFSGRRVHEWDSSPKYLNPPETPLFVKSEHWFGLDRAREAIRKSNMAVIVEGYFDVIALHQEGETRAIASMGTAINETQLTRLFKLTSGVMFCFDNDKGGRLGIRQLLPKLLNVIEDKHEVCFAFIPDGVDPDEFIRNSGIEQWRVVCETAISLSDMLMRYVTNNFKVNSVDDKKRAAIRAEGVCKSIKNAKYLKQILIHSFRDNFGISLEVNG